MQRATIVIMLCLVFVGSALSTRAGGGAFGATFHLCKDVPQCSNADPMAECIEFPKGKQEYYYEDPAGSLNYAFCG